MTHLLTPPFWCPIPHETTPTRLHTRIRHPKGAHCRTKWPKSAPFSIRKEGIVGTYLRSTNFYSTGPQNSAKISWICMIWKTRATPGFIFSRLQYSKYLAAVRVTKGDKMWQRWTPVPPIWLYERGLLNSMTLDDMHIYGMPSS